MKSHWMNFIFFINNRENCSKSIVQSISFHNKLNVRNSISKDGSRSEYLLKRIESITTGGVKLLEDVFLDETCQWNNNV